MFNNVLEFLKVIVEYVQHLVAVIPIQRVFVCNKFYCRNLIINLIRKKRLL